MAPPAAITQIYDLVATLTLTHDLQKLTCSSIRGLSYTVKQNLVKFRRLVAQKLFRTHARKRGRTITKKCLRRHLLEAEA